MADELDFGADRLPKATEQVENEMEIMWDFWPHFSQARWPLVLKLESLTLVLCLLTVSHALLVCVFLLVKLYECGHDPNFTIYFFKHNVNDLLVFS